MQNNSNLKTNNIALQTQSQSITTIENIQKNQKDKNQPFDLEKSAQTVRLIEKEIAATTIAKTPTEEQKPYHFAYECYENLLSSKSQDGKNLNFSFRFNVSHEETKNQKRPAPSSSLSSIDTESDENHPSKEKKLNIPSNDIQNDSNFLSEKLSKSEKSHFFSSCFTRIFESRLEYVKRFVPSFSSIVSDGLFQNVPPAQISNFFAFHKSFLYDQVKKVDSGICQNTNEIDLSDLEYDYLFSHIKNCYTVKYGINWIETLSMKLSKTHVYINFNADIRIFIPYCIKIGAMAQTPCTVTISGDKIDCSILQFKKGPDLLKYKCSCKENSRHYFRILFQNYYFEIQLFKLAIFKLIQNSKGVFLNGFTKIFKKMDFKKNFLYSKYFQDDLNLILKMELDNTFFGAFCKAEINFRNSDLIVCFEFKSTDSNPNCYETFLSNKITSNQSLNENETEKEIRDDDNNNNHRHATVEVLANLPNSKSTNSVNESCETLTMAITPTMNTTSNVGMNANGNGSEKKH